MSQPDMSNGRDPNEDLTSLITLEPLADGRLRSLLLAGNQNGRVFGGQLLGQALSAAAHGLDDRPVTALQFQFLQGALCSEPIHYQVETLQQGRRFTSRHVRAVQGERTISYATASFQVPDDGFEHQSALPAGVPQPESLSTLDELDAHIARTSPTGPYTLQQKCCLDLRLIEPERFLYQPAEAPRLSYWVRARHRLGDTPALHAAALAYISDYWLNYAALCSHIEVVGSRDRWYVSSLNHALWLHRPCRADEWLLFLVDSPNAGGSRGLNIARVFDRQGRLVASVAQEGLASARQR